MSDVKAINVSNTSYNVKDSTARTQAGRINLTKSGNNLVFTNANGSSTTIAIPSSQKKLFLATSYYHDNGSAMYFKSLDTFESKEQMSTSANLTVNGVTATVTMNSVTLQGYRLMLYKDTGGTMVSTWYNNSISISPSNGHSNVVLCVEN